MEDERQQKTHAVVVKNKATHRIQFYDTFTCSADATQYSNDLMLSRKDGVATQTIGIYLLEDLRAIVDRTERYFAITPATDKE